jgi:hypothetical protein
MATNPRKKPDDAALSAVEEALRVDYSPEDEGVAEPDSGIRPPRERRPEGRTAAIALRPTTTAAPPAPSQSVVPRASSTRRR